MLGVWKRTQNCKFTVSVQESWHSWVMCGHLTWSLIHERSGNGDSVLWLQARLNESRKRAILTLHQEDMEHSETWNSVL